MITNRLIAGKIVTRLLARGAGGEPLPLLTGQETLEELKEMIILFSKGCPAGENHPRCPFPIMSGFIPTSSGRNLLNTLSYEACVGVFEMEQECRFLAAAMDRSSASPKPAARMAAV